MEAAFEDMRFSSHSFHGIAEFAAQMRDLGFTGDKEGIQQALGDRMGQQPVANIVQEGEIDAWVGQLKAEGLFPIHAAADGIRRLTIGEPFDRPA
jgi:hypothetical protein